MEIKRKKDSSLRITHLRDSAEVKEFLEKEAIKIKVIKRF